MANELQPLSLLFQNRLSFLCENLAALYDAEGVEGVKTCCRILVTLVVS